MNRTILIVICDFLLVSLLAFSTVDINKTTEEGTPPQIKVDIATNQVDTGQDLAAVMRLALEDERKNRDQLMGELTKTRGTLTEREKQAQTLQQELQQREQHAQAIQKELQARQQEAQRLQREQTALQHQQAALQQQYAAAQTNLQALTQKLQASSTEAVMSKEQLAAMEAELRKRAEQAAALQQQLAHLASSNQAMLSEKQQLAGQLQLAEVERRHATEQVVALRDQVKVEREEKAKLVEGVKTLATNSTQLAQEIRENRPLAANSIFNDFVSNRVHAEFSAVRAGLLGADRARNKETEMVLVTTDGTNIFALCHVEDTPLSLWTPGTDWEQLSGTLNRNTTQSPIRTLSFHLQDPRVVFMPVTQTEARKLGGKIYRISTDPFKFQDAVLVGAREGYYGECKFEIDLSTPNYVRLDRSVLRGMFGKFNPSRGDLVFSKQGELLGVMANSTYCLMLPKFDAIATFQFGQDLRAERTGGTLSALHSTVQQFPMKLQ
jgi:membrane protein involved in colicin uptake